MQWLVESELAARAGIPPEAMRRMRAALGPGLARRRRHGAGWRWELSEAGAAEVLRQAGVACGEGLPEWAAACAEPEVLECVVARANLPSPRWILVRDADGASRRCRVRDARAFRPGMRVPCRTVSPTEVSLAAECPRSLREAGRRFAAGG